MGAFVLVRGGKIALSHRREYSGADSRGQMAAINAAMVCAVELKSPNPFTA
jgi:hypothetical protein